MSQGAGEPGAVRSEPDAFAGTGLSHWQGTAIAADHFDGGE